MTPPDLELVRLLGNSGPFALGFAWLLNKVLVAWADDRKRLDAVLERSTTAMGGIAAALQELRTAIEGLSDRLDDIERMQNPRP